MLAPELAALKQCLVARGWEVTVEDGGVIGPELPKDQVSAYEADHQECGDTAGVFDPPTVREEEAKASYAQHLDLADCVAEAGFPVDPPPSEEAFVEALVRGEILWTAYSAVMRAGDGQQLDAMLKACPEY